MGQPNTDPAPPNDPATPPADPAKQQGDPAAPPAADKGAGGKDAVLADLAKERDARQALEKQVAALAPLAELAKALHVKPDQGKTDVQTLTDQIGAMQKDLADERLGRLRLEVAAEKGLTPAQAARLTGGTRDELAADADALKALFPGGPAGQPGPGGQAGTPAPDPTQGARGGANELQALLKTAQEKGNTREVIRLKTQIAAQNNNTR